MTHLSVAPLAAGAPRTRPYGIMAPFDLRNASVGDRVEHEFLVRDRSEKTTRAGLPFVILTLANRSGTIDTAPIWSEKLEWAAGAEKGKKGTVLEVNAKDMKIKVQGIKIQTKNDRKEGFIKREGFIDYSNVKMTEQAAPKKKTKTKSKS